MMIDLLVVHPGAAHGIYGKLGDELVAVEPPAWARIIAAYVRDRGYSVKIIDAEARKLAPVDVAREVASERPRLVCIAVYGHQPSASTQQMDGASKTAIAIKGLLIDYPIIMVGGHVSALPERTLREEKSVDYACVGEGPVTVTELIKLYVTLALNSPATVTKEIWCGNIPGLVWRNSRGMIQVNKPAPLIEDISQLHGNAWDLLPMDLYRAHNWQCLDGSPRQPYASIYTTLGCPYKCSFCCINAPFGSNQYRMRDPFSVVAEILKLYHEYGVKTFKIVDEMFVLNERHYTTICKHLLVHPDVVRDINIWAYARVDTVKPHTLDMFYRAGIRWLALGIESGSKYVRDGANKRLKNNDIIDVVRSIQAAGINVIGNYIFGLPDDTQSSMEETLALAMELNTEFANFYCAMAYPGSPLYAEAVAKNYTLPTQWRGYSQHNSDCRPLDTFHLPAAKVLQFRDLAFLAYFCNSRYVDMIRRKFGQAAVDSVSKMTEYRLERKLLTGQIA